MMRLCLATAIALATISLPAAAMLPSFCNDPARTKTSMSELDKVGPWKVQCHQNGTKVMDEPSLTAVCDLSTSDHSRTFQGYFLRPDGSRFILSYPECHFSKPER